MFRFISSLTLMLLLCSTVWAQSPSYSKDIRPFLSKYCIECHNAKMLKGTLNLDSYKALMDGSDSGPVVKAGQPNESKLVLLTEHKQKPSMPPPKAKFQPTKDEVKLLRAWVAAGARDDGVSVKVELPAIKVKAGVLPPVTAMDYDRKDDRLLFARGRQLIHVDLRKMKLNAKTVLEAEVWNTSFDAEKLNAYKMNGTITSISTQGPVGTIALSQAGVGAAYVLFRTDKPIQLFAVAGHSDSILDMTATARGTTAFAGADSKITILGTKPTHVLKEHSDAVYGLAFNPDGKKLASVSADRAMKVWDVEKGKLLYTLGEATDWLYTVAWSPDGKYLVSGGVDKSIRVYEALTPGPSPKGRGEWNGGAKLRQSVFAHEGPVQKVLFSGDSKTLYSVGQDRVIKAWDVEKMVERKVYDKQPETVLCMALREDAGQIIIGRYDGVVQLIDMKSGKVVHEFGAPPKPRDERSDSRGSVTHHFTTHQPAAAAAPGDSPRTCPKIKLPAEQSGTLDRAGAVHYWRFDVTKGQSLGVEIVKQTNAKFDPVLVVTDMAGTVLAESHDGHLGHTFLQAGSYALGVRDREYRGGADFKYKLKLGQIPVVNEVFPLGMQRGTKRTFQLDGVFIPKTVVDFAPPADAKLGQPVSLPLGMDVRGKAQIVTGELPEVVGGGKLAVNSVANGRIQKENQHDQWTFAARKGQRLVVEVHARRLGSRLDSVIEIVDSKGQPVPRAVLRSQAKTHVTFRDHDSVQGNIRIEAWSELKTNDYLYVGADLMKIVALPTHPDADCNFFQTQGQRIGFLDTTPTHHANNTPMYKVTVHPPGTTFPPNGFPVFTLYYRNDDGGPGFGRDSRILFDPPSDGEYKVRITDARGLGGVNFGYRLTVREPRPRFLLKVAPEKVSVSKGSAVPITFTAERLDGFEGPIHVKPILPAGLHMPPTTIEAGTYATVAALYADADAVLAKGTQSLAFEGSAHVGDAAFTSAATMAMPTLIEPGDIVTRVMESEVSIRPGTQAKMTVLIERRNGFKGRVPLDVRGLPHGVRVLDIGLNGILVNENETTRTVAIYAEPWVPAQDHPFVVLARREGKNTEHAAKAVVLQVK